MPIGYQKEIDTHAQSSTNGLFQYTLVEELKTDIILTQDIAVDDEIVKVSAGHGFTGASDEKIMIFEGDKFIQSSVKSVSTNDIGIYVPSANNFDLNNARVVRGSCEMRVDASAADRDFVWKPTGAITPIDMSTAVLTFFCGAQLPDLSKFGGAAALTNGIFFRHVNGMRTNLGNYRANRDFKDVGGDVDIGLKGPGGTNSVVVEFNIEEIFGQVERFFPASGCYFLSRLRDKLDVAGIDSLTMSIIGSYTKGEA